MSKHKTYVVYNTDIDDLRQLLENKYYNAFMNSFKINGVTDKEERFILRKLYANGKIAGIYDKFAGIPIFADYIKQEWDLYDEPSKVKLINIRNSPLIPKKKLIVGEAVVLGYLLPNQKGVKFYIDSYIPRILQVEDILQTNLIQQRTPYIVNVDDPKGAEKAKDLINKVLLGEKILITDVDKNAIQIFLTQTPYLIDKLYIYEQNLISELESLLGIDNAPQTTMNAGLSMDQVNANNNTIRMNNNGMLNYIKKFCDDMNKLFGTNMSVETTQELPDSVHAEIDYDDKEGEITSENYDKH